MAESQLSQLLPKGQVSILPALRGNLCSQIHRASGEGNGNPLQYSCLENPMDGGAWWAAVHGVTRSRIQLSDFTFTFHFHALEKEMATHSVFLPEESQGWGSLVGCCLWGRTESDTTDATQQQQTKNQFLMHTEHTYIPHPTPHPNYILGSAGKKRPSPSVSLEGA